MDINQIVTIKLLNAISQVNSNNRDYSNNQSDMFDFILQDALGGLVNSRQTCQCNHNFQGSLETLDTLLSSINSSKLNTNEVSNIESKDENKVELNKKINITESKPKESKVVNTIKENIENIVDTTKKSSNKMENAVKLLESKVGNKYVWGATGPNTFDCSGLVQYVYKNALGKNIPRTSYEQSKFGQAVNKENLQVGDLVFFDTMGKGRVSHVGMYVGNNEFIHAANEKDGIKKSKLTGYYQTHYRGARRP
ncbi:C40 family peptidase [Paraclostridium tenue]|nr:C40 family peptidase [[Eubacterium] tenue]MBC8630687.1 C40 family peptidase [[Eubacterium] tenue]MDU1538043.1 C40 family peptidase [Paeniclostridium sordellii]